MSPKKNHRLYRSRIQTPELQAYPEVSEPRACRSQPGNKGLKRAGKCILGIMWGWKLRWSRECMPIWRGHPWLMFFKTSWKSGFLCEHSVEVLKTRIHKTHLWDKFCLGPRVPPLLLTFTSWYQALPSVRPEVYMLVSVPLLGQEEMEVKPSRSCQKHITWIYHNHEETAGKPKCRAVLQHTWPEEECKKGKVVKTKGTVKWSRLKKIKKPDDSMQCLVLAQILDPAKKMAIEA